MDSLDGYVSDDELAVGPLAELGWDVNTVSWRDNAVDWNDFEVAVIRTTWDYQRNAENFLATLARIESSACRLENCLETVKWNLDKRYLRDLETRGIPVVSTIWNSQYSVAGFAAWLKCLGTDEIILKPTVSATAEHTYRLREYDPALSAVFADRPFMVQPFLPSVVSKGEISIFYFDGDFSHAIVKRPKSGDFRVQEEHGGIISRIVPGIPLLEAANAAASFISPVPLYARVDLVKDTLGKWLVMELELIEPALYFRMDPESPYRFARALTRRMDKGAC